MNIVLVSPNFPPNYYHFATALRRLEANVLGLGDAPYHELRPELRAALTEYYKVDNLSNYEQLVRACGYLTHRYGKLERLESHNEYWLETDARLREDFNIPGPRPVHLDVLKRKSRMKRVYQRAGGDAARGKLVRTLRMAQDFAAEVGYPLIAKPDVGVGAANTFKVNNDAELQRFFEIKPPVAYFLEEFVQGELYSFDGLADQEGEAVFFTAHHFNRGIMDVVNEDLDMYYYSLREIPEDLYAAGMRALRAFDVRERFFHIEFFRTPERLLLLEINMRPPGGLTLDMFNYANDIDVYQGWAEMVLFGKFSMSYSRPYHCAYIGRKWRRPYRLDFDAVLQRYGSLIVQHEPISPVLAPAIGEYGYVLRSPELPVLQEAIEAILALR
ncbi:MAG TPA: ATP-grasp domain-containing protein [Anaerolineae bacterium]|nr:ATP-grasp domain-containing protein [Anaerolineae bacterium]